MAEIALRGVSKHFGGTVAVRDASFTIDDGEFFVLVGPSGCGKSTLLNLIVGLEIPSDGEILMDGQSIDGIDPKDRNMAMVFQSYAIYPHMTVRENIAFPLKLAGMSKADIAVRIDRAAELLELESLLDRRPGALSGGQRQRVAMGRAIVREPRVFLLDEPLSNLDARLRAQMRVQIARLQSRLGTTTVYVTHDQTEAMTLGDRIAVLEGGEIRQIGTPKALYRQPRNLFVAGFIGSPAMNFLPARRAGDALQTPLGNLAFSPRTRQRLQSAAGPFVVGFRPDDLRSADGDGLSVEARAEVVEWLGTDVFVHFDVDVKDFDATPPEPLGPGAGARHQRSLIGRLDPAHAVGEGDVVRFALHGPDVHVFDALSGENLSAEPN